MRGTFMLTNGDYGGLHHCKRQININYKDNTYPKCMGKLLSFFILVIDKSTTYYKYAVDLFFYLQKIGLIA